MHACHFSNDPSLWQGPAGVVSANNVVTLLLNYSCLREAIERGRQGAVRVSRRDTGLRGTRVTGELDVSAPGEGALAITHCRAYGFRSDRRVDCTRNEMLGNIVRARTCKVSKAVQY